MNKRRRFKAKRRRKVVQRQSMFGPWRRQTGRWVSEGALGLTFEEMWWGVWNR